MATPVCTIDENGITAPTYTDVQSYLATQFQGIYGSDIVIDPDSQDGQLIAIFAAAIHDANSMAVAVYNAFSPTYAQGAGLSSVVKINGISRAASSNSTADLTIIGQAGAIITNGKAQDLAGNYWSLPATVTIPNTGQIVVTATCDTTGAISATAGAISDIATPSLGWQSVTNAAVAVEGAAVETDADLRRRQKTSVAIPSLTVLEGIVGAVANLAGVARYKAYENDTDM
ncbi:MAG: baseplate J/gp47 family protein [Neorhizobium sp.]|nr:baseplate J/gp47 family protein [Neorhizobium sp.]